MGAAPASLPTWLCVVCLSLVLTPAVSLSLDKKGRMIRSENEPPPSPEQIKNARLDYVKWSILQRLDMSGPPSANSSALNFSGLPAAVQSQEQELEAEAASKTQTKEYILLAKNISELCRRKQHNPDANCMRFHLQEIQSIQNSRAVSAVLYVFKTVDSGNLPSVGTIEEGPHHKDYVLKKLDKYLHPKELVGHPEKRKTGNRHRGDRSGALVTVNGVQGHWIKFHLKHHFRQWLRKGHSLVDLQVFCKRCLDHEFAYGGDLNPFIMVEVEEAPPPTSVERKKRKAGKGCGSGTAPGECCMEELVIDFAEIGWNWVLHPKQFTANFCKGECKKRSPFAVEENSLKTYNFLMQSYRDAKFSPCCAPLYFLPIELLYKQDNDVIVRATLENMVVGECGCY